MNLDNLVSRFVVLGDDTIYIVFFLGRMKYLARELSSWFTKYMYGNNF